MILYHIPFFETGLCEEGGAGRFIDSNDNTYGGRTVVNPSGGLISKGHPLGATGKRNSHVVSLIFYSFFF